MKSTKKQCEHLRQQSKQKFDYVKATWIDSLRWTNAHRAQWLLSQTPGERKNHHIVDPSHILARRSYVAGFMEGNTSSTRPWTRIETRDMERNDSYEAKSWLQHFTTRVLYHLSSSNFYHAVGAFYYDYCDLGTGAQYIEQTEDSFFIHTLMPGSYYVLNDAYGEATTLVREYCLNVAALVEKFGRKNKKTGKPDWSNISREVRKMYEDGNYGTMIDIVHVIKKNPDYDWKMDEDVENREWLELEYEAGANKAGMNESGYTENSYIDEEDKDVFLRRFTGRRKPFIIGKSTETFEYGETCPTQDALGLIKSLNKKAISKDRAIEQILAPTLQGPASLRKSYITNSPNAYIPIDSRSAAAKQKVESVYQINPAIGALVGDVEDMRRMVDKIYYADYLMYLSQNPKTRTARETDAIVDEQQRIIGPNLQSLNRTYNTAVLEWVMDYTLYEDPYLLPPPTELEGQRLKPEMISVFAQAMKAADMPAIDRYTQMIVNVGQLNPTIWDKINLDKLADLYEDRLYLPAGLNNPQNKVDAKREQAAREAKRQQALQETLPAVAGAARDMAAAQK